MSANHNSRSLNSVRLAAYLFPPLGLVCLWRSSQISLGRKIFGTIGILLYSILYTAGIIWLLMLSTGLQIEWRGGFPPVLTFSKTVPNYEAVELDRSKKAKTEQINPTPASGVPPYWTGFRGPERDGHYDQKPISTNWPTPGLPVVWKQPCGAGYASFCIAEGMAFTIEQRREQEFVVAYDVETGRELWTHQYNAHFDEPLGGEGPRATPSYDDGKIYSLGAMGDLFCLEARSGRGLWQRNIFAENQAELLTYGMASSPLIVDEKIIVCPGGPNNKSVAAYHKVTGKPLWSSLNDPAAYSSPMLVKLAGQRQLLIVTAERAVGLTVEEGRLLWEFPWVVNQGNRNIAQPVLIATNQFVLSAGYGTGCAAVEVVKSGEGFSARQLWCNKFLKNKFASSVFWNGHIYGLDEDILTCLNAQTGERRWKEGRYGYGQLLLASEHLVILTGDGQLALVKATPEGHAEVARSQAIRGKTWNQPAMADGKIFVRNLVEMACFDISGK